MLEPQYLPWRLNVQVPDEAKILEAFLVLDDFLFPSFRIGSRI